MITVEEALQRGTGEWPDECVEWTGYKNCDGYGRARYKGKKTMVHRAAWERFRGEIPAGLSVLHRCDNPCCYNVSHLFLGTLQDNMDDKVAKGRQYKGERHFAAKLDEAKVRLIRDMHATGFNSMRSIGRQFGVHHSVISKIVKRELWRDVA